jgi:DNA helicase HerA-like ATPase
VTEVGRVLGTEEAHPLNFWVGVAEDQYLQLDDIVAVESPVPGRGIVTLYGVVDIVRSQYEGAKFESDVFRIAEGVFPAGISTAAHVSVTRVEPEIFVPPIPGQPVVRAEGAVRDTALYFDGMQSRFAAGLSREGDVIWGNLQFLDGTRGAHVNISGISGVATKTSYALFLLYGLFHSDVLGANRHNARGVIFNVKGEDLMFADKANARLPDNAAGQYEKLGLPCGPFQDVALWAPASKNSPFELVHDMGSRQEGVTPYVWSLREFCQEGLLRFLFAEADVETSQLSYAIGVVERYLANQTRKQPRSDNHAQLGEHRIASFDELVDFLTEYMEDVFAGSHVADATKGAFLRRLGAGGRAARPQGPHHT